MKAVQSDVQTFLEGSKQFVLPLYQRRYSWHAKHWSTLARDLERLMREPARKSHFIGSFVTAPLDHAADQSVSRYRLIDGQQRLTTIMLLLAALRDVAAEGGQAELAAEVNGLYLTNQYKRGEAARKLVPTHDDQGDLAAALAFPAAASAGRIGEAYRYFAGALRRLPPDRLDAARRAALGRLAVVSITLEAGDDPHLIFESLNAKGERLTQADLLRNYFLMRLPQGEADAEFARLWRPMQIELGDDLTSFFRHYLMRDVDGAEVRKDEVYEHVKDRVDRDAATPPAVVERLAETRRHAGNYARLVRPDAFERDPAVAARVLRLHRLKVTTAYPFLLNVLDAIDDGRLVPQTFADVLDLIETFLVRRLACGVPTNQLRVVFRGLCGEAAAATDRASFLLAVRAAMSQNQRCPSDAAFRDAVVRRPIYGGSKRDAARYLLERIERSFGHKETPDPTAANVQVEHVLPQTLNDAWRASLSPDDPAAADEAHGQWLHTLGNLTLTAYNPELSNRPFADKRAALADSKFSLNDYFSGVDAWTPGAIESRGNALADRALALWPDFAVARGTVAGDGGVRRRRVAPPSAVVISGVRHPVRTNLDATRVVLTALLAHDPVRFERALATSFPKRRRGRVAADGVAMRAPRMIGDGHVVDLHGSGGWLQQRCRRMIAAMGLPPATIAFEVAAPPPDERGR